MVAISSLLKLYNLLPPSPKQTLNEKPFFNYPPALPDKVNWGSKLGENLLEKRNMKVKKAKMNRFDEIDMVRGVKNVSFTDIIIPTVSHTLNYTIKDRSKQFRNQLSSFLNHPFKPVSVCISERVDNKTLCF